MQRSVLIFFSLILGMMGFVSGCHAAPLNLVVNASSEYVIVLPDNPSKSEAKAAERLRILLKQISSADIPVITFC